MNTMLSVLLALAIFVICCDAQCTFEPLDISPGSNKEGCRDHKGNIYNFDTAWESNCLHCSCSARIGLTCCNIVMKPSDYDKVKCKEIFNKQACMFTVVRKDNPKVPCKVRSYKG